jgi:uridine kinase
MTASASTTSLFSSDGFSEILYEKLQAVSPAIGRLALYEFRYALDNLTPAAGWGSIFPLPMREIEYKVHSLAYFEGIEIKPKVEGKIVLDKEIRALTNMLLAGLVQGVYSPEWINRNFSFDPRGFNFLVKPTYMTDKALAHLGGKVHREFEKKQKAFESALYVGYRDFEEANQDLDSAFIEVVMQLIRAKGTPILLAIAGPTAAGKTEIVERLTNAIQKEGKHISSVEMDNFLTDRDQREARGIGSLGREALHFNLFTQALHDLCQGKSVAIPRYDFIDATSSHDVDGNLKPGGKPVTIQPADIIFVEGNAPFLYEEVADLIGIKVVYLTDDAVRLKRKWLRDIDLRKKYDPYYLRNRYFKEQYPMAQKCYHPQLEKCDIFIDTTNAALWVTPAVQQILR